MVPPVLLAAGVGGIVGGLAVHYLLSRWASWAGLIVPVVFCAFMGWIMSTHPGGQLLDFAILALGLLLLLTYWGRGRASAKARRAAVESTLVPTSSANNVE